MNLAARCPQFNTCSAPKCPLDSGYHRRADRQAGEPECRSWKSTRLRIVEEAQAEGGEAGAAVAALPFGGLTGPEHRGRAAWEALTPEQQEAERARLRAMGAAARGNGAE